MSAKLQVFFTGQQYLSPNALAEMWKEELINSKTLEAKFKDMFSNKGVSNNIILTEM